MAALLLLSNASGLFRLMSGMLPCLLFRASTVSLSLKGSATSLNLSGIGLSSWRNVSSSCRLG